MIGWDSWIKKRENYLSSIYRKGDCKTFTVLQKMTRYLLIYYKTSFFNSPTKFTFLIKIREWIFTHISRVCMYIVHFTNILQIATINSIHIFPMYTLTFNHFYKIFWESKIVFSLFCLNVSFAVNLAENKTKYKEKSCT